MPADLHQPLANETADRVRMALATRMLAVSGNCPEDMLGHGKWSLPDFTVLKKLGVGGASAVYQASFRNSSTTVALKLYFKSKMTTLNVHQVHREVAIHSQISHPNIIDFYGAFEDSDHIVLVLQYAAKGDLFDLLRASQGRMRERDVVRRIMAPFMSGLAYLHALNIVHRDIKLENTLFDSNGVLKIADFGLSIDAAAEAPVTRLGTLDYMSPEVLVCPDKRLPAENKELRHLAYSAKVDSWACGVLAYELIVGSPPFGAASREASVKAILHQQPRMPQWMSAAAADFVLWALTKKPSRRPGVLDLLSHTWIQAYTQPKSRPVPTPLAAHRTSSRSLLPGPSPTSQASSASMGIFAPSQMPSAPRSPGDAFAALSSPGRVPGGLSSGECSPCNHLGGPLSARTVAVSCAASAYSLGVCSAGTPRSGNERTSPSPPPSQRASLQPPLAASGSPACAEAASAAWATAAWVSASALEPPAAVQQPSLPDAVALMGASRGSRAAVAEARGGGAPASPHERASALRPEAPWGVHLCTQASLSPAGSLQLLDAACSTRHGSLSPHALDVGCGFSRSACTRPPAEADDQRRQQAAKTGSFQGGGYACDELATLASLALNMSAS